MTRVLNYGQRVKFNDFTGTIVDPDGPEGQPDKGYRPEYEAVWVHYDRWVVILLSGLKSADPTFNDIDGCWFNVNDKDLELIW